jgi:hypothetical protein
VADGASLTTLLGKIYRAENLKRLANRRRDAVPASKVDLLVERPRRAVEPLLDGGALRPGDRLIVGVKNDTGRPFDVWVFYLDSDLGLTPVFPRRGSSPRLDAEDADEKRLGPWFVDDRSYGTEFLLAFSIPREEGSPPVILDFLGQPPAERLAVRGGGLDGLSSLLDDLAYGARTRGARTDQDLSAVVALRTFRTDWGDLAPPARFAVAPGEGAAPAFEPLPLARSDGEFAPATDGAGAPAEVALVRTARGYGAGVRVAPGGDVVTALSVVAAGAARDADGRREVTVTFPGGDPVPAVVAAVDPRLGLALLRPRGAQGVGSALVPAGVDPGNGLRLVGHPGCGRLWSAVDVVPAPGGGSPDFLRLGGTFHPGQAGAPLLTAEGRIAGVVVGAGPAASAGSVAAFLAKAPAPGAALGPEVPDVLAPGRRTVRVASGEAGDRKDLLVSGGERPDRVWIDLDGDSRPAAAGASPADGFDAEIVLQFVPDGRIAFYDTDGDGTLDLVLVDDDGDPEADALYRLAGGRWTYDGGTVRPFLRTIYVRALADSADAQEHAVRVLARFRAGR